MSSSKKKRGLLQRVFLTLMIPGRSLLGALVELWGSFKDLGIFRLRLPFLRGRRNREFEKAGRQPRGAKRRRVSGTAFRKGERQRKRELIEAERESRKFLTSNSAEAAEYREQLERSNKAFSRGDAVNHLAKMNAKLRKPKQKSAPESAPESTSESAPESNE